MFLQSCFIRKNTPELRKKLEELGYKICKCCEFEDAVWLDNFIEDGTIHGIGYFDEIFPVQTVEEALNMYLKEKKPNNIDCGYNEELFLAIAALRDDSCKNQYFINKNGVILKYFWDKFRHYKIRDQFINYLIINDIFPDVQDDIDDFIGGWRKATVQELIEHFKNK